MTKQPNHRFLAALAVVLALALVAGVAGPAAAQEKEKGKTKKPNVVMLMTDDTGWDDFGCYMAARPSATRPRTLIASPRKARCSPAGMARRSCTAGRASFMTGRIPIRTALSVVVVPGDPNGLTTETPTIAEFFQKNGYRTYFSGKWHLGDVEKFYPIEHGFDEMKHFAAYYPGVYTYDDTSPNRAPLVPEVQHRLLEDISEGREPVRMGRHRRQARDQGQRRGSRWKTSREFDVRQADSAVDYIKKHAKDDKPFFMDVNFMKMHNPNIPAKAFAGKSHLGNYSDSMLELDSQHRPDHGRHPRRGAQHHRHHHGRQRRLAGCLARRRHHIRSAAKKARRSKAACACPASCGRRARFRRGWCYHEMMSHMDVWPTTAAMVGLTPPPHGDMKDNDGKPIYFDGIDNSAYVTGKAKHSARDGWIYIDGENFCGVRADVGGDPENPDLKIAWKILYTSKDTWLGPDAESRRHRFDLQPHHGPLREIRHDVQRRGRDTQPDHVAGPLRRDGQWLGPFADGHTAHGVQQVDRRVSEHQTLPGRSLERHDSESAEPEEPVALRSDEGAEDDTYRRLTGWFDGKTRAVSREAARQTDQL